ncbi:MAG: cobaltochelatase subunit CobN [Alphaproteobacteria bacterium]
MHLLAASPLQVTDASGPVLLAQTPGDIVVLSAAASELACLAVALGRLPADAPTLRLASLLDLAHNLAVDHHVGEVVAKAKLVVVRLLGGRSYWPYGVERVVAACRKNGIRLALLSGDERFDDELADLSTLNREVLNRLHRYFGEGGAANAEALLRYAASLIGRGEGAPEPTPLPRAGTLDGWMEESEFRPVALLVFYRALVQASDLAPIEALADALRARGLAVLAAYVTSLRDGASRGFVESLIRAHAPAIVLNATAFAVASDSKGGRSVLDEADAPVLQVVLSGETRAAWAGGTRGLTAKDIAMHVALPEMDGRILTRAVSFKAPAALDPRTELAVVRHAPEPGRIDFVADLAARWVRLRHTPARERRVALVLANYPNRDGRIGNGVGLDTPASAITLIEAMRDAGYDVDGAPIDGDALMRRLVHGQTNDHRRNADHEAAPLLPLADYRAFFDALPEATRNTVEARWGDPESDPFYRTGKGGFALPVHRFGNLAIGIQPARGYNIDPKASYHDPALPPPHGYLAFYAWLRQAFGAHAVIQLGKHGNLEWLPGKALALSAACFPEAALGPTPLIYPFIVNDPGEGAQAKRRSAAVVVDHLMPPLARAGSHGGMQRLEALIDEYYDAASLDPRRLKPLAQSIIEQARAERLDDECGIGRDEPVEAALLKLDSYLCELKERQIRDGLHVLGRSPEGRTRAETLLAFARAPRGSGAAQASILRALAADLGLGLDPLDTEPATRWEGPRPDALTTITDAPWRSIADTVERLDMLALALIDGRIEPEAGWAATRAPLDEVLNRIAPALDASGRLETARTLAALDGRFVPPGPAGAPSRGRPDVLPTGRNFFSVDSRAVPTPAAWHLGFKSAQTLCEDFAQRTGDWPRTMALTAWGTSNMRTGGDDIAQGLALIGARPTWEPSTGRVSGFEILPVSLLGRPRVDVTLRISGFFRDAFPGLIDLFDSAVRAVATLREDDAYNPIAAAVAAEVAQGRAERHAAARVFGSMPGAYGAGLQALIDEGGWQSRRDLAEAYLAWGGFSYGGGAAGEASRALLEARLALTQAIVQNQDNYEHDLLDSDDYYQFEGGLAAAVEALSGRAPVVYHNDHSLPERPRMRTLEAEIARTVRARASNPKWIAGVMRHGYKGAFEIAATVDYLFAFAATTDAVKDHQFDALYDAYMADEAVRGFMASHNPDALAETARRFLEALRRGLWRPRSNAAYDLLTRLSQRGAA